MPRWQICSLHLTNSIVGTLYIIGVALHIRGRHLLYLFLMTIEANPVTYKQKTNRETEKTFKFVLYIEHFFVTLQAFSKKTLNIVE